MKKLLVLVTLLLSGAATCIAGDKDAWEQLSNEDGITVWRREVAGSPVVAVKGEAVIAASLAKTASVLADTSRAKEWVCSLGEARVLRVISPTARIEYNRLAAPWPVSDRDFVFSTEIKIDRKARTVTFELKSVVDALAPPDDDKAVRGELLSSTYVLTQVEERKTKVTVEIQVDPKGSIPKWLVNYAQKGWPRGTLEGVRDQAAKADVKELALLKDAFVRSEVAAVGSLARR
jgi:hypothetical protein